MKQILFATLILLTACTDNHQSVIELYRVMGCNRDGCIQLFEFKSLDNCSSLIDGIVRLHAVIRKEKPTKIFYCYDVNNDLIITRWKSK